MQLRAVELLRLAKEVYSYQELSRFTNIPVTVLNRYVKGHILPNVDRAEAILYFLEKNLNIGQQVLSRLKFTKGGFVDNTKIIFDTTLLRFIAEYAIRRLAGRRISKVLTVAVDGIPFASQVASLLGIPLVYAKKEKEVGVESFLEETCAVDRTGMQFSLYLPKDSIERRDSILIVDDVVRSGEQLRALTNLAKRSGAEIAGIFILIAIGDRWKHELEQAPRYPVEYLVSIPEKQDSGT